QLAEAATGAPHRRRSCTRSRKRRSSSSPSGWPTLPAEPAGSTNCQGETSDEGGMPLAIAAKAGKSPSSRMAAGQVHCMKLFAGNSNRALAEAVARYLNMSVGKASVRRFADQEIFVEIQENVRGQDVFILQS